MKPAVAQAATSNFTRTEVRRESALMMQAVKRVAQLDGTLSDAKAMIGRQPALPLARG